MTTSTAQDTIFAVSSGIGRAAIAVIRVSGPRVRFVTETIAGDVPPTRLARLRRLKRPADGAVLDEALVLFFAGPASETGEDIVEFQVHGGRAVVAAILATLASIEGLRPAEPGEFARRALLNGKMDLLDLEALADLIDADTELQRQRAIEGGGLMLRQQTESWREQLLDIRADLETDLDFSDEGDVARHFDSYAEQSIRRLIAEIDVVIAAAHQGERMRDGFRVVLAGPPNAGKSSLMNVLARRDVAIVSAIPGTTRDRIDVFLDLHGVPVHLTDTAGMQETEDQIEREGIRRSRMAMTEADLVLWLSPVDAPAMPSDADITTSLWVLRTKGDLADFDSETNHSQKLSISVKDGRGIDDLLQSLEAAARSNLGGTEPHLITRARQRHALVQCRANLESALVNGAHPELAAEDMRLATLALERLVGRVGVEEVLGAIFSRFCIGK